MYGMLLYKCNSTNMNQHLTSKQKWVQFLVSTEQNNKDTYNFLLNSNSIILS